MVILSWFFFVIFAFCIFAFCIGFLVTVFEEGEKHLLMFGVTISVLSFCMFFFSKEIFTINTSILILKIVNTTPLAIAFIYFIRRKTKYYDYIYLLFILSFAIIPFFFSPNFVRIDDAVELITTKELMQTLLPFENNIIYVSSIVIVLLILIYLYIRKKEKERKEFYYSVKKHLGGGKYYDIDNTFDKPYNKLMFEKISSELRSIGRLVADHDNINKTNIDTIDAIVELLKDIKIINSTIDKPAELNIEKNLSGVESENIERTARNEMVKQLNHFLQTPFSAINLAVELSKIEINDKQYLEKRFDEITNSIQICDCVLKTYRNIEDLAFGVDNQDFLLDDMIHSAFDMYVSHEDKKNVQLKYENNLTDTISDKCLIISILLPLIQNAVVASPSDRQVKINCIKNIITIENFCITLPKEIDLQTSAYSSKQDHRGTGLMIARDLCNRRRYNFEITVDELSEKVIQKIEINYE